MTDDYILRRDVDNLKRDVYNLDDGTTNFAPFATDSPLKNIGSTEDNIGTLDGILEHYGVFDGSGGGGGGDLSDYYTKEEINGILSSYVTSQTLEDYQPLLESGVNIKTINNQSILGSGNINIGGGGGSVDIATYWHNPTSDERVPSEKLAKTALDDKVNRSELHNLDINLTTLELVPKTDNPNGVICFEDLQNDYQEKLVSGTNIKTINNQTLLGSGNINIQGGGGSVIGTGSFSINNNGHLVVELPNGVDNPYFINNQGHLVYDTSNTHNGS